MDWQEMVALGLVAMTVVFWSWRAWRSHRAPLRNLHACHCPPGSATPGGSIVFHARKGERPQVRVKFR
jgi:hypothetical protein